ncbi:MAG: glucose-6-phosphate isomerase [bacterium]|nr:glucose-6-phosphate isomerase [bacterium]
MNFEEIQSYNQLKKHSVFLSDATIYSLFKQDKDRFSKFSQSFSDILFDFSKNLIDEKAFDLLLKSAEQLELKEKIRDMFDGVKINSTERRSVLHTALRSKSQSIKVDGKNIMDDIKSTNKAMYTFAENVRNGVFKGINGTRILDVVNIGIGGSYLGPLMATEALKPYKTPLINFHFVSNVDGTDIKETLKKLSPETTLFIIASKTFTTDETMTNAETAKEWIVKTLGQNAIGYHFCAVSSNVDLAVKFGIKKENIFGFGNYVGGRYSMWGPIGLPLLIAIGSEKFNEFLDGARKADEHFLNTPFEKNIPVIMALLSIWNVNFLGITAEAVLPYDNYLRYVPLYLQQLVMESNGKSIDRNGKPVSYKTCPVVFGEVGTNGQHSFYQLLHQGTEKILCDFILPVISHNETGMHQEKLLANGIAQTEALMKGKSPKEVFEELKEQKLSDAEIAKLLPYKVFTGNRPSNTFLIKEITPETFGMLIAFYEHKTFVEGVFWNINSFDQFGVELGKQLAKRVLTDLQNPSMDLLNEYDSSTASLIEIVKDIRK